MLKGWILSALLLGWLVAPAARAELARCERDAVSILYSYANSLKSADTDGRARVKVDDRVRQLESAGFFRNCPEVKNRVINNLDLIQRFNKENLPKFIAKVNATMALRDFERIVLQVHNDTRPVERIGECKSAAQLCRNNYDLLFRSMREIGGPDKYEDNCVKTNTDGKPLDRACDYLKGLKGEGIDHNTGGEDFLKKHSGCGKVKEVCDKNTYAQMIELLNQIHARNVHQDPITIEFAVRMKYDSLVDCKDKLKLQKDISSAVLQIPNGDIDLYCSMVYEQITKCQTLQYGGIDSSGQCVCRWGNAGQEGTCNPEPESATGGTEPPPTGGE